MKKGDRIEVRNCSLNGGRYNGRKATVIGEDGRRPMARRAFGGHAHRLIVKLDRFQPGFDSPDGIVYLRDGEYVR